MTSHRPLVSVLLPMDHTRCLSEGYVASAFSIIGQTYPLLDILTLGEYFEVADSNEKFFRDKRVRVCKVDRVGSHGHVAEWNFGLAAGAGDVFFFLEPGMTFDPHYVETIVSEMFPDGVGDDAQFGLLMDPAHPESPSRTVLHRDLRELYGFLNQNFRPPFAEWVARLRYHAPEAVRFRAASEVKSIHGDVDPEPPDNHPATRRLEQYSGFWNVALHP